MNPRRPPYDATYVLPAACSALLVLGAVAAGGKGHVGPTWILAVATLITVVVAALADLRTTAATAVVSWLTVTGFSRAPYAELQTSAHRAFIVAATIGGCAAIASLITASVRGTSPHRPIAGSTLVDMIRPDGRDDRGAADGRVVRPGADAGAEPTTSPAEVWASRRVRDLSRSVSRRRQLIGFALCVIGLPLATAALVALRPHLALDDDLLLYLVAVVAVTVVGGFWPAVVAAIGSCLLLNWYFAPPLHHWTIDSPQNLLALLLFVTMAVTVSSIVHLSARRATLAARSQAESSALLGLARTVLRGDDTADNILEHLSLELAVDAELQERVADRWVRVAGHLSSAPSHDGESCQILGIRPDLRLRIFGDDGADVTARIVEGYAVQSAAALDRERLRIQAAQAEMLAAGNRMRTALLAAVSHDLRTPLAAVKASVSSLRLTDVTWSEEDEAELLATIEDNADRLDALIANLLDMSRIQTGSLQPLMRPTSLDEIAPMALRGLDATQVALDLPDSLPLVVTDPGLLERALANLLANALRYSPVDQPARMCATVTDGRLIIDVADHGPGVPPELREKIFEPFQQLGDRRTSTGVGLGLAVARGFVESLGGELSALATPGGGLTMRVELPAATPSMSTPVNEST